MPNRGALLVLILLALGITAGGAAVWYHRHQTHRPLELWGTDGSVLIERAPRVTLYRLVMAADGDTPKTRIVDIGGQWYPFIDEREISGAPGFSHVRWGLCQDSSFDWEFDCDTCDEPQWKFAISFFGHSNKEITLFFDTRCGTVMHVASQTCVSISPIAAEVEQVLLHQLPDGKDG